MKLITLGLAATLAFSAAHAQAASPVTFTITAESGAGALTPSFVSNYSSFEGGDRLNVQTVLHDETYTDAYHRYVYHFADTTYDRQGGYRDTNYWTFYGGTAATAPDYVYFKGSATIAPDAAQTVPMAFEARSHVSGTYTSVTDPRFPNVSLYPGTATVAVADSHNPADLAVDDRGYSWFNPDGTFSAFYYGPGNVIPAGGTADMAVLFYLPAQLYATSYSFELTGPLYNEGLHHFSDTSYVGLDILPVPEPSTWAMLLAGVGIVGIARRRKTAA